MRIRYGLIMGLCIMLLVGCGSEPIIEDGFEKAVYEKYDSFADENGLGGTLIFIEGKISEIYNSEEAFVVSTDEGEWAVSYALGGSDFETKLYEIKGRSVKVYGVYVGKSEKLQLPVITIADEQAKITDEESGRIILDFWDYCETGLKEDWNVPNLDRERVIGNIAYLEPVNWKYDEKTTGTSSYLYYYPYAEKATGMLYVYVSDSVADVNYSSLFASMLTKDDEVLQENDKIVAGEDGYYARYTHLVDGVPYEVSAYMINTDANYFIFMFSEINSLSKNMEMFSEDFMSCVFMTDSLEYKSNRINKTQAENKFITYALYQNGKGEESDFCFSAEGIVSEVTTTSSGEVMWFKLSELTDVDVQISNIWIKNEIGTENVIYGDGITVYGYVNESGKVEIYGYEKADLAYSLNDVISKYKNSCKLYSYDNIARNPEQVRGENAKISGEVIQVLQDDEDYILRVNIDGNYNQTVYVVYSRKEMNEDRILEDDWVNIYGDLAGTKTYTTVLGGSMTIPQIYAEYIEFR